MLILPYLLKGIAAFKTAFILATSTSASWYSHADSRPRLPTIGPGILTLTVVALTIDMVVRDTFDLFEPVPALPPIAVEHFPTRSVAADLTIHFDSGIASSTVPDDDPPVAVTVLDVPELDWSNPGFPTVRTPKVEEPESDVVYTGYYIWIVAQAPANSSFWQERPFVPVVPDDDIPPMPRYQHPFLLFDRHCRTKGFIPDHFGFYRMCLTAAIRINLLIFTVALMLYDVHPIPGLLLQAWREMMSFIGLRYLSWRHVRDFPMGQLLLSWSRSGQSAFVDIVVYDNRGHGLPAAPPWLPRLILEAP
ncbi:hypothetical protein DAEQUDRAFT_809718 [Daedalea quercina L-15889]|uniref:Uncharacterized protein n=1 Tax=Daedalea quercina L-15889 TaxID=1314783 RepID=A0A165SBQ5_9APHY|nr:hypothetical protein DAEQUDRAFT_809718 [Daedalea quercina L-15889]